MAGSVKNSTATIEAAFSFEDYKFTEVSLNLGALGEDDNLIVEFRPSGEYNPTLGLYKMTLDFIASNERSDDRIITIRCVAFFKFREPLELKELPLYFYANSTAILYPYIRAFVSTLSLQANFNSIMLPTLNVSALADEMKDNTVINNEVRR